MRSSDSWLIVFEESQPALVKRREHINHIPSKKPTTMQQYIEFPWPRMDAEGDITTEGQSSRFGGLTGWLGVV
jgi:hypothetical protein